MIRKKRRFVYVVYKGNLPFKMPTLKSLYTKASLPSRRVGSTRWSSARTRRHSFDVVFSMPEMSKSFVVFIEYCCEQIESSRLAAQQLDERFAYISSGSNRGSSKTRMGKWSLGIYHQSAQQVC